MTEHEWLVSEDPQAMLECLNCDPPVGNVGHGPQKVSDRKLRLFACACARQVWHLLTDPRSRRGVEAAERFADGEETPGELDAAKTRWAAAWAVAGAAAWADAGDAAGAKHAAILRDIAGNPFRLATLLKPDWLTPQVLTLAHAAYDQRDKECPFCEDAPQLYQGGWWSGFRKRCACKGTRRVPNDDGTLDPVRLAILADALEEAGCNDENVLRHLRSPGPHYRGCHVLDTILGKS